MNRTVAPTPAQRARMRAIVARERERLVSDRGSPTPAAPIVNAMRPAMQPTPMQAARQAQDTGTSLNLANRGPDPLRAQYDAAIDRRVDAGLAHERRKELFGMETEARVALEELRHRYALARSRRGRKRSSPLARYIATYGAKASGTKASTKSRKATLSALWSKLDERERQLLQAQEMPPASWSPEMDYSQRLAKIKAEAPVVKAGLDAAGRREAREADLRMQAQKDATRRAELKASARAKLATEMGKLLQTDQVDKMLGEVDSILDSYAGASVPPAAAGPSSGGALPVMIEGAGRGEVTPDGILFFNGTRMAGTHLGAYEAARAGTKYSGPDG